MPTWRMHSRSRSFRLRAAAIAALLVLITVSILASGAHAPPIPGHEPAGTHTASSFGASTQPGDLGSGPPGPPTGNTGDDAASFSATSSDELLTELLADSGPGAWDPPGQVWATAALDHGLGMAQTGGGDADAPGGPGGGMPMIGGPFGGALWAFHGANGPGGSGPGQSDCASNPGPANDCVVQQLKDLMPDVASFSTDPLADPVPTSFTESDMLNTPDDPSTRGEAPVSAPEPPAWLLGALALIALVTMPRPLARVKARGR